MKYKTIENGEPYRIKTTKNYDVNQCCDCGLVHDILYKVLDNEELEITYFRNRRATGQIRRYKKRESK